MGAVYLEKLSNVYWTFGTPRTIVIYGEIDE